MLELNTLLSAIRVIVREELRAARRPRRLLTDGPESPLAAVRALVEPMAAGERVAAGELYARWRTSAEGRMWRLTQARFGRAVASTGLVRRVKANTIWYERMGGEEEAPSPAADP